MHAYLLPIIPTKRKSIVSLLAYVPLSNYKQKINKSKKIN